MPTNVGPHLLGRVPSLIDLRDYPLGVFLNGGDDLDAALAALESSWEGKATKKWAAIVTARVKSLVPAPTPPPTPSPAPAPTAGWLDDDDPVLDQGNTGHCVGFGGADWLNALPVDDHVDDNAGHAIYYEAKQVDGEPNAENGSTVRSLAKVLQQRGRLKTYAFASTVNEITQFVTAHGPVIMGTDWTQGMFSPDQDGFVEPKGQVAGGHCYLAVDYDPVADAVTFLNSWGPGWGQNGRFKMHTDALRTLFVNGGEACAGVELAS